MKYLIDADWTIDYLTGRPSAHVLFPTLMRERTGMCTVTLVELYEGVYTSRDPRRAERELRLFLRGVTILPINRRIALRAARLRGDLRGQKAPIAHRAYDIIVAAAALTHGLTWSRAILVTTATLPDLSG